MKSIKNEKLIKRNGTISNWCNMGAFAVFGVTIYASFKLPPSPQLLSYTGVALIAVLILMQIGMYLALRFGPSPRPDEKLDAAFKGLQNEFVLYHYTTPASHLLVGPAGVWVLMPYHQGGRITFEKNRWRNTGGGFMQSYMRLFGMGLGRPDIEIEGEIRSLKKYLSKAMQEAEVPEINAMLVFTNDNVELDTENAPMPAMKLKQIKDFIRQRSKEKKLPAEALNQLKAVLE